MSHDIITAAAKGRDWVDYWTLAFIGASAVVLAFYTWYTRRLMKLTSDALDHAQKSSEVALAETQRSNDAVQKSNEISERSLELSRRAWVIATGMDAPTEFFPGDLRVKITLRNSGGVPAVNVVTGSAFAVLPSSVSLDDDPVTYHLGEMFGVVPVRRPAKELAFFPLSEDEARGINSGDLVLYILHRIDYADAFRPDRWSLACWQYSRAVNAWVIAPKHNHAE